MKFLVKRLNWRYFGFKLLVLHLNADYLGKHLCIFLFFLFQGDVDFGWHVFQLELFLLTFKDGLLESLRLLLAVRVLFSPYFAEFFLLNKILIQLTKLAFKIGYLELQLCFDFFRRKYWKLAFLQRFLLLVHSLLVLLND